MEGFLPGSNSTAQLKALVELKIAYQIEGGHRFSTGMCKQAGAQRLQLGCDFPTGFPASALVLFSAEGLGRVALSLLRVERAFVCIWQRAETVEIKPPYWFLIAATNDLGLHALCIVCD